MCFFPIEHLNLIFWLSKTTSDIEKRDYGKFETLTFTLLIF